MSVVAEQIPPAPRGSTELLPEVRWRRFSKPVGFLFFVWGMLGAAVLTVISGTSAILALLVNGDGPAAWWVTRAWARAIGVVSGMKAEATWEAPLPDGPVVFVCNHQSTMDILALFVAVGEKRPFVFVAKKSIFRIPFLGWFIWLAGYISVDRGNHASAVKSLKKAGERIRGGKSVMIFPEGTRSRDGSILPFKKGPFMVALQAGVPIVPVAIEGALQMNPRGSVYLCPNPVRMLVGSPIETAGLGVEDRDDLMRRVRDQIIRQHRRLGGLGGDEANAIAGAGKHHGEGSAGAEE